ncbi:Atc1p [Nakaseomyces bracarensis]|uniref:Atc1p n=1 Tax=Nakaseomyces bracarensis TaxID=273131 RepID=UPI003872A27F
MEERPETKDTHDKTEAPDDSLTVLHRLLTEESSNGDNSLMDLDSPLEGFENEDEKKLELDYRNQFEVAFREANFQGLEEITDEDSIGKHLTLDSLLKMDQGVLFKDNEFDDEGVDPSEKSNNKREREDGDFDELGPSTKKSISNYINDKLNLESVVEDQMLSPISLSPTPSDGNNSDRLTKSKAQEQEKSDSLLVESKNEPKPDITRKVKTKNIAPTAFKSSKLGKGKHAPIEQKCYTVRQVGTGRGQTKLQIYDSPKLKKTEVTKTAPAAPKVYTNEFTMKEVAKMKRRVIDSHRLLLNFNVVKEGYARTCVQLKQSVIALKDSEIRRAHLMMENEDLKDELEQMKRKLELSANICSKCEGPNDRSAPQ